MIPLKLLLVPAAIFGGLFTTAPAALAQTWVQSSAPVTNWSSVATSADGNRLVAAILGGGIQTSTNAGVTWTTTTAAITNWTSVASSASGGKLVAAANGGCIYISTDFGANWTATISLRTNWSSVASSADGAKLVAAVSGGGIYTSQSTPRPTLGIIPTDSDLILSWIVPSTDFHLQENSRLRTTNWTDVEGTPILNFTNLHHQLRVPISAGNRFYRLEAR